MPVQQGISQEVYCHRYIYDSEVYHATILAVLQTALDIAGRGKAQIIRAQGAANESQYLKVTIDGNVVVNDRMMCNSNNVLGFYGIYAFNSSLKVEHRTTGGVNSVTLLISYCVR